LFRTQKQKIQDQKEQLERRIVEEIKEEEEWNRQNKEFLDSLDSNKSAAVIIEAKSYIFVLISDAMLSLLSSASSLVRRYQLIVLWL
jgi:hypothetical protein